MSKYLDLRPATSANGYRRTETSGRRISVTLDDETFELLRSRARGKQTSFAEQIRLAIEWGLKA